MNHPFTVIKSRAWLYFVRWSLWMFTLDEMRMKTAFIPFTLDESTAMHIQSVKCKFALSHRKGSAVSCRPAVSQFEQDGAFSPLNKDCVIKIPDFLCYTVASLTAYKRCGKEENKLCLVPLALFGREFVGISSVCEILRELSKINVCSRWLAYPVWCLH